MPWGFEAMKQEKKLRIGVSSCLLGAKVRYDGGHKKDQWVLGVLSDYADFVPSCPEYECGLSIPRPPMHLEGTPENPRLIVTNSGEDLTRKLAQWCKGRVKELSEKNLDGYIFKSKSPSCGLFRVKYYNKNSVAFLGRGIFASEFCDVFSWLPVEEEGRLCDMKIRENFIQRLFVMKRWRELLEERKSHTSLLDFHTSHKLLVMSHSLGHYRTLGRLLADSKKTSIDKLYWDYWLLLNEALGLMSTTKKRTNVLQHMQGYFKKDLDSWEKKELTEVIEHYRTGLVPLIVPLTLLRHYVNKYDKQYLKGQHFLEPHPFELCLLNHV